jgi:hypothetical protein
MWGDVLPGKRKTAPKARDEFVSVQLSHVKEDGTIDVSLNVEPAKQPEKPKAKSPPASKEGGVSTGSSGEQADVAALPSQEVDVTAEGAEIQEAQVDSMPALASKATVETAAPGEEPSAEGCLSEPAVEASPAAEAAVAASSEAAKGATEEPPDPEAEAAAASQADDAGEVRAESAADQPHAQPEGETSPVSDASAEEEPASEHVQSDLQDAKAILHENVNAVIAANQASADNLEAAEMGRDSTEGAVVHEEEAEGMTTTPEVDATSTDAPDGAPSPKTPAAAGSSIASDATPVQEASTKEDESAPVVAVPEASPKVEDAAAKDTAPSPASAVEEAALAAENLSLAEADPVDGQEEPASSLAAAKAGDKEGETTAKSKTDAPSSLFQTARAFFQGKAAKQ